MLEIVEQDDICQKAAERGQQFREGLLNLLEKYWCIGERRGRGHGRRRGLLQGIEIISDRRPRAPVADLGQAVFTRCHGEEASLAMSSTFPAWVVFSDWRHL